MPLTPVSMVYATEDAKLYPMLTDPEGGTATYGDGIDMPGIKAVGLKGNMEKKVLRGDNKQLATVTALTEVTGSVSHAKMSLTALAAMLGGTVTQTGTTPAQRAAWVMTGAASAKPFMLVAKTPTSGGDQIGGSVDFALCKCVLSGFPEIGTAEEDFAIVSFEVSCDPRLSDDQWLIIGINETALPLPTDPEDLP